MRYYIGICNCQEADLSLFTMEAESLEEVVCYIEDDFFQNDQERSDCVWEISEMSEVQDIKTFMDEWKRG